MKACLICGAASRSTFQKWDFQFHRCGGCGLEFIDPQPDDAALAKIYGDAYFDAWGRKTDETLVRRMKRETFRRFLRHLGKPSGRLLDCGAATGHLAELARDMGWDSFAVELSPYGARACAERLGKDHACEGKIEDARFGANPENRFEAITMIDVIEHVRDPRRVLAWAREHLAPRGRILLVTPRTDGATRRLMGRHWHHFHGEHLWYLNPSNIVRLMESLGYGEIRTAPAAKVMMLAYGATCLMKARRPLMTPLLRVCLSVLPRPMTYAPFSMLTGDMLVTARVP